MRILNGCILGAALIVCLGTSPTSAAAATTAPVAVTQPATQITTTTVTLNGTIDPSSSDSAWAFQYGPAQAGACPSNAMSQTTSVTSAGAGSQQVSASVSDLSPDRAYCFQLVVAEGVNYQPTYSLGGTQQFMTLPVPATVATTGPATSVTATSAILNGVANTTTAASQWAFRYGPSPSYGQATRLELIGPGVHALSYRISGLIPNTVYHYQVGVAQYDATGVHYSLGADRTFRTPPLSGRVALQGWRLRVARGQVALRLACHGAAGAACRGRLELSAGHAERALLCASGTFSLAVPRTLTLHERLSHPCATLLGHARGHRLGATMSATYLGSAVVVLRRRVVLLG